MLFLHISNNCFNNFNFFRCQVRQFKRNTTV